MTYFHLQTFNIEKNYTNSNVSALEQNNLERAIVKYNNALIFLNGVNTPLISEDLIKFGKGKKRKLTKKIDYRQLRDGCHPSGTLTRLWLIKFINLIDRF